MKGRTKLKSIVILFAAGIFFRIASVRVYAAGTETIWQSSDMMEADEVFQTLFPEYQFDGKTVFALILQGRISEAVRLLADSAVAMVKGQEEELKSIFSMILILGITAAIFSGFVDIFQSRQVSEIAFYFVYLLLIVLLLKVFGQAASIVKEMLNRLITFMQLFIPVYLITIGTSAGAVSATAYHQLFFIVVYFIETCYLSILIPGIDCFVLLSVINGVWMEEKLTLLLELIQKCITGCIKITIGIITGFSILQSMISPIVDALETSAFKKAVSAIPGIGNLTEGMFEMVIGSAVLIKNSVGIYITVFMIFICIVPIVKIFLLAGVLKAAAALVGMVSDKRVTNCANRVGDGSFLLLKLALSAIGLFIICIAIAACATNRGM